MQGLDHIVVLGQGRRDDAGDKLGLGLETSCKPWTLTAMALMLLISLATGPSLATAAEGPGAVALFPRTLGKGQPAPPPALILWLGVSMKKLGCV